MHRSAGSMGHYCLPLPVPYLPFQRISLHRIFALRGQLLHDASDLGEPNGEPRRADACEPVRTPADGKSSVRAQISDACEPVRTPNNDSAGFGFEAVQSARGRRRCFERPKDASVSEATLTRKICGSTAARPKNSEKCGANVVRRPFDQTMKHRIQPLAAP
jgi:hypothetical protein